MDASATGADGSALAASIAPPEGMGMDDSAPEANAYEFQSAGVVTLLKKLQDDFRSQLGEAQKEEMNAQKAYDLSALDHTNFIENAERAAQEKNVEKDRKAEKQALTEKQLSSAMRTKAEDEKT